MFTSELPGRPVRRTFSPSGWCFSTHKLTTGWNSVNQQSKILSSIKYYLWHSALKEMWNSLLVILVSLGCLELKKQFSPSKVTFFLT